MSHKPAHPTPITDHLSKPPFADSVYPPSEDTYILLDALENDLELLTRSAPSPVRTVVEIGAGSGCVSAFLASLIGKSEALYLATDLNPHATLSTVLTAKSNNVELDPIQADLVLPFLPRLLNSIDLLVFNPPYVPTEEDEVDFAQREGALDRAWAGGWDGMKVTDRLLAQVPNLLSPTGLFYLVAVPENKPLQIIANLREKGLDGEVVLKRRAGREHLHVLRFKRAAPVEA